MRGNLTTQQLYKYKWSAFVKFTHQKNFPTNPTSLSALLAFLSHLSDCHLSLSTLKVYLSAIEHTNPGIQDAASLFKYLTLKQFLRGVVTCN